MKDQAINRIIKTGFDLRNSLWVRLLKVMRFIFKPRSLRQMVNVFFIILGLGLTLGYGWRTIQTDTNEREEIAALVEYANLQADRISILENQKRNLIRRLASAEVDLGLLKGKGRKRRREK